jgi:nitrate/nitrite transporter NarK
MFFRVSVAVIGPSLIDDLGFTVSGLSDLSSAFFYAFAIVQIPLGITIDRIGARKTFGILSAIGVAGSLLFAGGWSQTTLIVARVLLGLGMSGNFIVTLVLIAAWFPVSRFGFLTGLLTAVGVTGNLLAATPLAILSMSVGWRGSFVVFSIIDAALAAAFLVLARDNPPGRSAAKRKVESPFSGFRRLLGMYSYWAISLANFVRYGYFAALQGLWAATYLMYGFGFTQLSAGNAVFCLGLGYMIGLPMGGALSDRVVRSRKKVVLGALASFALLCVYTAGLRNPVDEYFMYALCFTLGFSAAPGQILYAHIKELIPKNLIAQALTSVNLFTVLGAGIMTQIVGVAVGADPMRLSGPEALKAVWLTGVAALCIVCVIYWWVRDTVPDTLEGEEQMRQEGLKRRR